MSLFQKKRSIVGSRMKFWEFKWSELHQSLLFHPVFLSGGIISKFPKLPGRIQRLGVIGGTVYMIIVLDSNQSVVILFQILPFKISLFKLYKIVVPPNGEEMRVCYIRDIIQVDFPDSVFNIIVITERIIRNQWSLASKEWFIIRVSRVWQTGEWGNTHRCGSENIGRRPTNCSAQVQKWLITVRISIVTDSASSTTKRRKHIILWSIASVRILLLLSTMRFAMNNVQKPYEKMSRKQLIRCQNGCFPLLPLPSMTLRLSLFSPSEEIWYSLMSIRSLSM